MRLDLPPRTDALAAVAVLAAGVGFVALVVGLAVLMVQAGGPLLPVGG